MKKLALVTSIYDLVKRGSAEHRNIDWMFERSNFVLGLDQELVIFTDPELETELRKRRGLRRTKIIPVPFEKLLRADRIAATQRSAIQHNANKTKVTPIYVQLMQAKYAMLEIAPEVTDASHLGWIDLAITHVAKIPPEGVDVFADPSDRVRVHVLRCFSKRDVDAPDYWRSVQGHLAGGLLVGARNQVHDLVSGFWAAVDRAISMGLAPLDEGLLSYVVGQRASHFSYSYGDYEDILRNHDAPRGGEAHCRWIVEDAKARGLPNVMDPEQSRSNSMGMYEHSFIEGVLSKHPTHAVQRVVETGTCAGYSTRRLSRIYSQVDTVELSADLSAKTSEVMQREGYTNVRFHVGDSAQVLQAIVREIQGPCLFYLDAHWSGDETVDWNASEWKGYGIATAHRGARGQKPSAEEQVPLLAEMQIICKEFPHRAIIYIDDFALFGADGRGRTNVSFVGNDWSHLHVDDLKKACQDRLVDWVVDEAGIQVAIVLAALGESVTTVTPSQVVARPAQDRPLLGLCMIVKNEAKRIEAVLASYRPYINVWTILDTGSTDGTQDLIRRDLVGIPGTLHEEPFVDFATSRNRALDLHGQATVFSIMPNGDVLSGGADLVSFLEAHRRDHAGAYRVRITPGHYYHPLVMRTGAGWRYKWRTHECATGAGVGAMIPGVAVIRDRGNRTDAEWRDRWTRDLTLLHRDRADDPSDPRAYFYLGQTHECLGQYAQALAFFERRAELGGYFDEVFEAKFRIGKMKEKLGRPWADIQQAYLEAHAHDPRRAEPLHAIAEHWYDKEQHAITRIFAVAAADLPKPPTDLFLDEEIYSWRAADIAAISSFYAGRKADGRRFAEQAVKHRPYDERLRANRAFYAPSASEMFDATSRAVEFQSEPGWNASNPSICWPDASDQSCNRLRCIVRTVNYKIIEGGAYWTPDGDGVIRTRNFLLDLDDDLKTTKTVEILDKTNAVRTNFPIHGFEDARLFAWKGKWWATATVCDFTEDGRREIALLDLDATGSVVRAEPLRGPWSGLAAQKNWMPLIDHAHDVAKIIYATSPPMIFDLVNVDDPGVPRLSWHVADRHAIGCPVDATFGHGRLRGGSQAVRVEGGWIFVVHDVAFPGAGRIYLHRFVMLNERLELVSMTDPFYFERLGIEFCAGLALVGEKLVASYAVNDGAARFGLFDWKSVAKALRTDFVI